MTYTRPILILKRDGTHEIFSLPKLRSCVERALRTSRGDLHLAAPVARAIAAHLQARTEKNPPTSAYVGRCVVTALMQTGLYDAAKGFGAHCRRRAARRQRVRVIDPGQPGSEPRPWCKGELAATLRVEYGLRQPVARFLAGRVEDQVFGLRYGLVSKTLLRELVKNEALAWGVADGLPREPHRRPTCEGPVVHGPREEET